MPLPPVISPFASPRLFIERRLHPERRGGERRRGQHPLGADRRSSSDRRHPMDRRESGTGHLRNALQTLMLLDLPGVNDAERRAMRAAARRLWFALFELQRRSSKP